MLMKIHCIYFGKKMKLFNFQKKRYIDVDQRSYVNIIDKDYTR